MRVRCSPWLLLPLLLAGCPEDEQEGGGGPAPVGSVAAPLEEEPEREGPPFSLGEGKAEGSGSKWEPVPQGDVRPLDEAATKKLLDRLPELRQAEAKSFARRQGPPPPPLTGETVRQPFPPPAGPPVVEPVASGPLQVTRFQPEGDVELAPHISLSFSQPMVAVGSVEDVAKEQVPVRLEPLPPGRWRWLGTTTLLFEPEGGRFPMATAYTVTVPAGTASTSGGKLEAEARWSFRTPPPRLVAMGPQGGPHERDPLVWLTFDQAIDPGAVMETVRATAGGQPLGLRMATPEEAKPLMAQAGRTVVMKPAAPLPTDTRVEVRVGPGTPSAEGPRKSEQEQAFAFKTYGPLQVVRHQAGWGRDCPPGAPFQVFFSNPLEVKAVSKGLITSKPEIPGLQVQCWGAHLNITGMTKARTTYQVTLGAELRDVFGQTLGKPVTLEFKTTSPTPSLTGTREMVVLDPFGAPRIQVRSISVQKLRVRVTAVEPVAHWESFQRWQQERWRGQAEIPDPPGREVRDEEVKVAGSQDEWAETSIDLAGALTNGLGHAAVLVEPVDWPEDRRWRPRLAVWVQATKLGLDVEWDATEALAWVTALEDGRPLEGVKVELAGSAGATTDATGLARFALGGGQGIVLARKGNDTAFIPGGWGRSQPGEQLRWFTTDDRHLYRPKEEVKLKGWIRRVDLNEGGDLKGLGGALRQVDFRVVDGHGQEIQRGKAAVDEQGGFDLAFGIPDTAHVGMAHVVFDQGHHHLFQIAEFRRPEFEVKASATSAGPHLAGDEVVVEASASYFSGGAVPGAPVTWKVEARATTFTPPDRSGWMFGEWVPWWMRGGWEDGEMPRPGRGRRGGWGGPPALHTATLQGTTDAAGKHHLRIGAAGLGGGRPMSLACEATVMDVNRQAWSGAAALLVHPAQVYVGLKSARPYVPSGQPLEVEALVVDIDGKAEPGRSAQVAFERVEWSWEEGSYVEKVAQREVKAFISGEQPEKVRLEKPAGGTWRVTALVADAAGRKNRTTFQVWVAGGGLPPSREVEEEKVTLVPDRETYRAGDVAELLVVAPFAPAEALFTVRRSGIVKAERLRLEGPTTVLKLAIEEGMVPDVTAHVSLVGSAPRAGKDARRRPAYAAGQLTLKVPPLNRALSLALAPERTELEPAAETALVVEVRDAKDAPVAGAQVAVAIVDEAVLMLGGHTQPDPLAAFYAPRGPGAWDARTRAFLQLDLPPPEAAPETQMGRGGAPGAPAPAGAAFEGAADMEMADGAPARRGRAKDAGGGGGDAPIQLRADLRALAAWAPALVTDAQGKARLPWKLPDSLTRYRVIAVAAAGAQSFGSREATVTARLPLQVRPSAPRFLNFGDRFELPIVVQNQTDAPLEVEVAVRGSNLELTAGQGRALTVPPRDRREVRFPASAARAGEARIQVAASSGKWADAQEVTLPVWTPATSEAFATYGVLDGDAALGQPIQVPDAWAEFGGLELTTSSTGLQALTDAVIYLAEYPYGCAEQVSSRVLALVAVQDVLAAFDVEQLPSAAVLKDKVGADLERLKQMQNPDGGWGFWDDHQASWPYLSIHVAHTLGRAAAKGYAVDPNVLNRAKEHLRRIEQFIPEWYSVESRRAIVAYALYARTHLGDEDPAKARKLLTEAGGPDKLSLEALGWIWPLLRKASPQDAAAVRRHFGNKVVETAGAANFTTAYSDGEHVLLHSERRVDGIVLEALLDDPAEVKGDLCAKLVQGLLAHKKRGRWMNTQENAFILLALDRYFRTAEAVTPEFVARAWLGDAFAGEVAFRGRTTKRQQVDVPMVWLQEAGKDTRLTLAKEGPGRLYYRIGLSYAPKDLVLEPSDQGFTVERTYEAVDDAGDVKRQQDGSWWIKAGARVRVRLAMVAPSRRYHVALVDPLPAGLEPLDPALRATGALPADPGNQQAQGRGCCWWWSRTWYEHSGLRDERAEAFTSLLWEGVHTFTYVARATTPGRFVAPPAKAEEMYAPETFGRSGSDVVVVE